MTIILHVLLTLTFRPIKFFTYLLHDSVTITLRIRNFKIHKTQFLFDTEKKTYLAVSNKLVVISVL